MNSYQDKINQIDTVIENATLAQIEVGRLKENVSNKFNVMFLAALEALVLLRKFENEGSIPSEQASMIRTELKKITSELV